ncbi:RING/U-box domain-containing protein [Venturia nashicola]|nr:RING/U-box domain-containing protein [Venturia nashicola]
MDLPIDEDGNLECTICCSAIGILNTDTSRTESPIELPCGHTFGNECLHQWRMTNNICPNCRAPCPNEEQYNSSSLLRRPGMAMQRREQGPDGSSDSVMGGQRGSRSRVRILELMRNLREEVSPRAGAPHDTIAGLEFNQGHQRVGLGPSSTRDLAREDWLLLHREAMRESVQPDQGHQAHHGFQAPTAASPSWRLASIDATHRDSVLTDTHALAAYGSDPNLRRARDSNLVVAGRSSNPNLRREQLNRRMEVVIAEANARRRLDDATRIIDGAPGNVRRRLNGERTMMEGAPSRHGDSMDFRAMSLNDLREVARRRTAQGSSHLNPTREKRQAEQNLLPTTPGNEYDVGSMREVVNMRRCSADIGRTQALDSHDPDVMARWIHQQSLAELHELMMRVGELEGSDLRANRARFAMAEIIQRRRQQRQSFMNELDRSDVDFAAEVGPILRVLDGEASSQITQLIRIRRETQEAIAEVERPRGSNAPPPSTAIRHEWEMMGGRSKRRGERRRS